MASDPKRNLERLPMGRIEVADSAISAIVESAVTSCYGIVDMAPRSLGSAIEKRLDRSGLGRGIGVTVHDGRVTIELSVVMEYGTPVVTVAKNVMKSVRYQVERTLGMPVDHVNVSIERLRPGAEPAGGPA